MTTTENIVETRPAPFTWAQSAEYSQGAKAGELVFTSGQAGYDDAGNLVEGGFDAQARQVFRNIEKILNQHGASLSSVVKLTAYLGDRDDFDAFKKVRSEFFSSPMARRSPRCRTRSSSRACSSKRMPLPWPVPGACSPTPTPASSWQQPRSTPPPVQNWDSMSDQPISDPVLPAAGR